MGDSDVIETLDDAGRFTSAQWLGEGLASMAMAISSVAMSISMAALVFAGPLDPGLPRAIGVFVVSGAVAIAILGFRSQIVPLATVLQDGPAVVMVAIAARVIADDSVNPVAEVFILIGCATFVTGLIMWLMGRFNLGHLVRYVPNTVVAAFIAGTGWLLAKGGFDVMTGDGLELADLPDLLSGDLAKFWVPGLVLGLVIWLLGHLDRVPPLAMSLTVVGSIALFYVAVSIWSSVGAVETGGWLIGPFPDGNELVTLTSSDFEGTSWSQILGYLPSVSGVVAVAIIAMLLNITGLEFVSGRRIDVDSELRQTGLTNLLISPLGSLPVFHALGDTVLAQKLGASTRVMPLLSGVVALGFGLFGLSIAGYMPRLVVGALLISVGVALLVEWIQTLLRSIHPVENLMSVGIVLVIAFIGILQGIAVGVVAACAVFVFRYSRIDPVKRAGSGVDYKSRVDYRPDQNAYLATHADRIVVYQLQGYLFFGSLTSLEERARTFLDRTGASDGHDSIVFDFRNVTGIDSSAYELLARLAGQITDRGNDFVMSHVEPELRQSLQESEPDQMDKVLWCNNLDSALEQVERKQLIRFNNEGPDEERLDLSDELLDAFVEQNFGAGEILMSQGDPSDELMIVCTGTLTASRTDVDGGSHRLRMFGAGALVGEIGFVSGTERTASVSADSDVTALAMTRKRYQKLLVERPDLVIELQGFILKGQAERIATISDGLTRSLR